MNESEYEEIKSVLQAAEKAKGKLYFMLDHWKPDRLKMSGYSILPVTFENGSMRITWTDEWNGIE